MASGIDNQESGEERNGRDENEVFDPERDRFDPSLNDISTGNENDTSPDRMQTRKRTGGSAEEDGSSGTGDSNFLGETEEPHTGAGDGSDVSWESTQRLESTYVNSRISHPGPSDDFQQNATYGSGAQPPAGYTPALQTAAVAVPEPKRRRFTLGRLFRDIIIPLVIAFAVAMFVQATVAKPYKIPSGSMLPTIKLGDRILADRLIYHFKDIQRGDIIVFEPPTMEAGAEPGVPFVKRVVALPGDTVEVTGGKTLVNGEEQVVPDADRPNYTTGARVVPEGMLYVLGDNRNESSDSHIWGFVPIENVIGRVELIYWPPGHIDII